MAPSKSSPRGTGDSSVPSRRPLRVSEARPLRRVGGLGNLTCPGAWRISQYERMPDQDARKADLLAGPRGRELSAMLAGIDVEALYGQLAPPRSLARLVADPADIAEHEAVAGAEAAGEIDEPPVVAANPGDELFGIRDSGRLSALEGVDHGHAVCKSSALIHDPLQVQRRDQDLPVLEPGRLQSPRRLRAEVARLRVVD